MNKLKLIISVLVFCFFLSEALQAQTRQAGIDEADRRELLDFGIRAGINYSNIWDEENQDQVADHRIGFAGGFFLSIPMGPYVGIQPEVLFSQKGYTREGDLMDREFEFRRTSTYIDIPVQLQVKPSPFFTLLAGPQYSIMVHDRTELDSELVDAVIEDEFSEGDLRSGVFGAVAGFDINIDRAVISARINWDLLSSEGDGTTEEPRFKNQWLQFTVGYRF